MRGIKGHGGYGEDIGRKIGGWIGDKAQSFIQSITGFGDYTVRSNTLVNGGSPPQFAAGTHCTKLCHREFVGLVTSPGASFNITPYPINPKSPFFPWLSEIALSFEQYRIRGMVVEFKTTSGTSVASTNTALGSVIIATQYNVLASAFTTQQQMEAYQFCTSCAPSVSMIHPIECDPQQNSVSELYVDSSMGDPRLEYLGTTYVATVGQQASSVIGELWISYEIDLMRPKLFSGVANLGLSAHYRATFSGTLPNLSTIFGEYFAPFQPNSSFSTSTLAVPSVGSDFPISFPTTGNGYMQIPGWVSGTYLFNYGLKMTGGLQDAISAGTTGLITVVSGAATASASGVIGVGLAAPSILASSWAGGSGGLNFNFTVTLAGNNPAVPVIIVMSPWTSSGTSAGVAALDFVVTGLATNF
jgi:hypothetical protein